MAISFVDCESINISYNNRGLATINYTIFSNTTDFSSVKSEMSLGGNLFTGIVTEASCSKVKKTGWYQINVTLVATTT